MAGHGAAANLIRLFSYIVEIRNSMNIDQHFRPRYPQFHHRHQTLTPSEKLGVLPMLLQKRDSFADATRLQIFKSCWIHRNLNPANGLWLIAYSSGFAICHKPRAISSPFYLLAY